MKMTTPMMLSGTTTESKTPEADELITQFSGMIWKIAKKWAGNSRVPLEDLIQEGRIAVLKAVQAYKEDRGTALPTYMYTCISNAIKDCYQKSRYTLHASTYYQKSDLESIKEQERRVTSTDKVISFDGDSHATIGDMLPATSGCPITNLGKLDMQEKLTFAIDKLSEKDRFIIDNYCEYFGELSMEEIAAHLKLTKQAVSLRLKNIKDKLRYTIKELE